jgi:hypothetical protein
MRLACSTEYYECHCIERFGFARSHLGLSSFPPTCAVFLTTPAPAFLRSRVHPLLSFNSPLEYVLLFTCPPPASVGHLPWDFVLHRDISARNLPTDWHPTPILVPPSAFLTLSTAYSSLHLVSLFHPTTTYEILSSGVSPDSQLL